MFGGVHILPFFLPVDGADAGFDPEDHTLVDPQVGSWSDIETIARDHEVMADLIVNHVSTASPQFRDFSRRGDASAYRGMFIEREDVFPEGPSEEDLAAIYRPRPGSPFTRLRLENGEERLMWTTFTPQQVDINVSDPQSVSYLDSVLRRFQESGVASIRLDAVGYAVKRAGTSCFMIPETIAFINGFGGRARELGMEVLVEVHSYYRQQVDLARHVDRVYDFALPPLVLHAFAYGTARYLSEWARIRPRNAVTVLDTHDGIGIMDVGPDTADRAARPGLIPSDELDRLVEIIHETTGGESRKATGAAASNLDVYQVNSTFFDAMGRDEERYLLARAVQFFLPGVPQVYYVGLLAGRNDMALLSRTGVGRDINRHYYGREEVLAELGRPVVRRLLELIRLRNDHPAFDGAFVCGQPSDTVMTLRWTKGSDTADLAVDFKNGTGQIRYNHQNGEKVLSFGASGQNGSSDIGDARVQTIS